MAQYLDIAQKLMTVLAIMAGGWWFIMQGEAYPRVNLSVSVEHRELTPDWTLVSVTGKAANVGKRPLTISEGFVRAQQVLPLDDAIRNKIIVENASPLLPGANQVLWPRLDDDRPIGIDAHLHPGEIETFYVEFFVPATLKTIRIYTAINVGRNDPTVWSTAQLYDLASQKEDSKRKEVSK